MAPITCVGILVADIIAPNVKQIPAKGKSIFVENISLCTGGCATNTSIALSKLGFEVEVIGKVGNDLFGDFILNTLTNEGVGIGGVKESLKNTANTMVLVDPDGERRFISDPGANGDLTLDDINWDIIKKSRIVHVAGTFLLPSFDGEQTAKFLKKAKKLGVVTTLDTAWDPTDSWLEVLEPSLPYIDYFLPNFDEAKMLSGFDNPEDISRFFLNKGVGVVGLKMGDKGSFINDGQDIYRCSPLTVKAVDTTGAGDSWVAGFLGGIYNKWSLEKIGRFANAVGASCVQAVGSSTGIKSYGETLKML